jgi:hypothetical protein
VTSHGKLDIAAGQLKSAFLLLASGGDRFSAITLAGAADVILSQLVLSEGKENFTDFMVKKEFEKTGIQLTRTAAGRTYNDLLMINALKHMDPGDGDFIEIDLELDTLATVAKAMANYAMLLGQDMELIQAFRAWARQQKLSEKISQAQNGIDVRIT